MRFKTELLTTLDRGKIPCLITRVFPTVNLLGCGQEETRQDSLTMGPFPLCLVFWLHVCEAKKLLSLVYLY